MFKKVSIIKKILAVMVAGMMVSSFMPVQAFSIKDSLDKAKTVIQRYWRENKAFRVAVSSGKVVAGVALWYWKMKNLSNVPDAEFQRRQIDYNNASSHYENASVYLDYLHRNNPTCCLWRKYINCRCNPTYLRKHVNIYMLSSIKLDAALAKTHAWEEATRCRWDLPSIVFTFPGMFGYLLIATGFMELKKELWDAN